MKCPKCNGNKIIITKDTYIQGGIYDCDMCHGTGDVEQTNDEWRKTCSAEEFAEWIASTEELSSKIWNKNSKDYWEEWLKQPHEQKGD